MQIFSKLRMKFYSAVFEFLTQTLNWKYKFAASFWKHKFAKAANLCFQSQSGLEVELQPELELAGVEGRRGAAAEAAVGGAVVDGVDVLEARRGGRLVEAVEEVEALGDDFEPETLAERDVARDAEVERLVGVRQAEVAAEVAGLERGRHEEHAAGVHGRPVGRTRQVVVRVA